MVASSPSRVTRRFRVGRLAARRAAPRSARGPPTSAAAAARPRPPAGWWPARPGPARPRGRTRRGRPRRRLDAGPARPSCRPPWPAFAAAFLLLGRGRRDRDAHHLVERPAEDALDLRGLAEVDQDAGPPGGEQRARPGLLDHGGRQVAAAQAAPGVRPPDAPRVDLPGLEPGLAQEQRPAGDVRCVPGPGMPTGLPRRSSTRCTVSRAAGATSERDGGRPHVRGQHLDGDLARPRAPDGLVERRDRDPGLAGPRSAATRGGRMLRRA